MMPAADETGEFERFLVGEARLLDERRFAEWLELFTEDATYWVPLEEGQADPFETVSLIYDDRRLLETRVRRLANPHLHAQLPPSRTSRIVANVTLEEAAPERGAYRLRSKLMMIEYRAERQRLFGATVFHSLRRTAGGLRIAAKRVDLVNSTASLDGLVVPF